MFPTRVALATLTLTTLALAGCVTPNDVTPAAATDVLPDLEDLIPLNVENVLSFTESVVTPAVGLATDLYEPTLEVSPTGVIYVAGHTVAAATTGTPAYYSKDDGKTWEPLPFLASLQTPPPGQGSQPPPGDEGFIVAGDDGQAWMADIYLAGFSVTGWCGDGAEMCYDNRNAYDRVEAATTCNPTLTTVGPVPVQGSLNDRPWAAYGGGKLLLVNNPGGGPMQLGVMDVPPATPVGVLGGAASLSGPTWNMCASPGGWIPGVPAMRPDGFFAVPQMSDVGYEQDMLTVTLGNAADIKDVENVPVFPVGDASGGDSNGGRTAFDAKGTLFVGAKNTTADEDGNPLEGRFILAVSQDDGKTFKNATFASVSGRPMNSLYLDSSHLVEGALLVWSELGEEEGKADWYVAHVFVGEDGAPSIRDVTLAVDEGSSSAAHIIGSGVGPDGRAYFLNFEEYDPAEHLGSNPMRVWIQQEGPALPLALPLG